MDMAQNVSKVGEEIEMKNRLLAIRAISAATC
jgi:hypothetical protein